MFVSKDNLNFLLKIKEDGSDISLWSDSVADFLGVSHSRDILPVLKDLHEKYPGCIIPHRKWSELRNVIYTAFYVLNKEGCHKLCKSLKAKPSLKRRFLNIISIH